VNEEIKSIIKKAISRPAVRRALILLLVFIGLGSLLLAANQIYARKKEQEAAVPSVKPTVITTQAPGSGESTAPFVSPIDFNGLRQENTDAVAWLTVPGTAIDYPIVQAEDNQYYVNNSAQKKASKHGAVFLDCRNRADFSDFYNIIYAHNMRDGSMFGTLIRFKQKDFFDKHKTAVLHTPTDSYELEIISCAVQNAMGDYYISIAFFTPEERQAHIDYLLRTAKLRRDIALGPEDRILILSTCSYEFEDARTIVVCKFKGEFP